MKGREDGRRRTRREKVGGDNEEERKEGSEERSEAAEEGRRKRRVMNRRGKWRVSHQKTRESERRESPRGEVRSPRRTSSASLSI